MTLDDPSHKYKLGDIGLIDFIAVAVILALLLFVAFPALKTAIALTLHRLGLI